MAARRISDRSGMSHGLITQASGGRPAIATAWPRDCTPSLDRIADTWRSTVLVETNRRLAIAELRKP